MRTKVKKIIDLNETNSLLLFFYIFMFFYLFRYDISRSLTIAIQDGALAGQSVPHCHVHIMPRKPNDFVPSVKNISRLSPISLIDSKNYRADEVYTALDSSNIAQDYERRKKRADRIKMDADEDRIARSSEVMKAEAIR